MWNILIDTSGMPPGDIYIGMFLINQNYEKAFITQFYDEFPELKHYNKKSTKAKDETLLNVLRFLSGKRLRMVCYHFEESQWASHTKRINELKLEINSRHKFTNFPNFKEKVMGILYYNAITHIGVKSDHYRVIMCPETYMDTWQVVDTIHKLAKRDGWDIEVTPKLRKHHHLLKMADYVAGANRRLDKSNIENVDRHTILKNPISDYDLKKVFSIWRTLQKSL